MKSIIISLALVSCNAFAMDFEFYALKEQLAAAISYNKEENVKEIIEKYPATISEEYNGSTPLISAVTTTKPSICKMLLDAGADPNQGGAFVNSPLCSARSVEVATMLLDAGANLNKKDKDGETVFSNIICKLGLRAGDMQPVIKLFLQRGAVVTPALMEKLRETVWRQRTDKKEIQELLQKYMKKNTQALKDLFKEIEYNGEGAFEKILAESPAVAHQQDEHGDTALIYAMVYRHAGMLTKLLQANVDVNQGNNKGYQPLFYAWDIKTLNALLDEGADPNGENNEGMSVLKHIILAGYGWKMGEVLIKRGAVADDAFFDAIGESDLVCKEEIISNLLEAKMSIQASEIV